MGLVMKRAGSGHPSANRITLLRDRDGDGAPETRPVFLEGLNSPALAGGDFYVAGTDALVRFPYKEGQTRITAPGVKVADLPAGPINHHWTKSLVASTDGALSSQLCPGPNPRISSGPAAMKGRATRPDT